MSRRQVFLIGPGFIGREILDRLLPEGYDVTTLTRRQAAANELQQAGAKTRMGGLDDHDIIADQTSLSDIVIHTATADHKPSVEAVIAGIEKRAQAGKKTIYIHNSGSGVLDDQSNGNSKSEMIYYDDKPEDIDALPDSAPHRAVDLVILEARKRLGAAAKMAIVLPPVIYGYNAKYGRLSIQMPTLTRFALKHGYAGHVGKGLSVWNQVHVYDVACAYLILLHWLERTDSAEDLENPYFFCENGVEFSWADGAAAIGKALHSAGRLQSAETKTIPEDQYKDLFGPRATSTVVGSNSRSRANRLRALGWTPQEKGLYESLMEDEIPVILQDKEEFQGYGKIAA